MTPDVFGLNVKHCHAIDATLAASSSALKSRTMFRCD